MKQQEFNFKYDPNAIIHLGRKMYSTVPVAIGELIANSWDADASKISITLNTSTKEVIIEDDGDGMSRSDVDDRYLNIAYNRREAIGDETKNKRKVLGRKGIGKLASFSIADIITIETKTYESDPVAFDFILDETAAAANDKIRVLARNDSVWNTKGTRLTLKLRPRKELNLEKITYELARRYEGLIKSNFTITINDKPILDIIDRSLYDHTTTVLLINTKDTGILPFTPNSDTKIHTYYDENNEPKITGWIGEVDDLKSVNISNFNRLGILALKRVVLDNIIPHISTNQVIENTYLYGSIHADFCDNTVEDITTSSRQNIDEQSAEFSTLKSRCTVYLREMLKHCNARREAKTKENLLKDENIKKWLDSLPNDRQQQFTKKFINTLGKSEIRDIQEQKDILRGLAIGFEESILRENAHIWDDVELREINIKEFSQYFKNFSNLEATGLYPIVKEKLSKIDKLNALLTDATKEAEFQQLIAENLWLLALDSYPKKYGSIVTEAYFKKNDTQKRNFIDILLYNDDTTDPPLIIELKKKTRTDLMSDDIVGQVNRYRAAVFETLSPTKKENARIERQTDIPCIIIVEKLGDIGGKATAKDIDIIKKSAKEKNIQFIFYTELVKNAYIKLSELKIKLEKTNDRITLIENMKSEPIL